MIKNALPSIDDIDDDALNKALLHGAQSMPSLSVKKTDSIPNGTTLISTKNTDPSSQRVTRAISLPQYVWDWIKQQHRENDEPQNVCLLRAMKSGGAPIREEDLADARKTRWAQK